MGAAMYNKLTMTALTFCQCRCQSEIFNN